VKVIPAHVLIIPGGFDSHWTGDGTMWPSNEGLNLQLAPQLDVHVGKSVKSHHLEV